jgi:hypothetical protein
VSIRHRVHRVIYVPLDDRPCNVVHVQLLARMVDYELVVPPIEMLGRYTTAGNADAIANWMLREASSGSVDCAILSLDMLAYGGLVGSRAADVRTQLALQRFEVLHALRQMLPNTPIYAHNAIMRLSLTATSDEAATHWQLLHEYSETQGRVEALGQDHDRQRLAELETLIPLSILGKYQACRERNHVINRRAVEETAQGNLDYLILAQEDAAPYGPHVQEQQQLAALAEQHDLSDRITIHPGADELGQTLFARFVHKHMEKTPSTYVLYSQPAHADNVAEFEDRPFSETLKGQLQTVGVTVAEDPAEADFILAINPPAPGARGDYQQEAAQEARNKQARVFFDRLLETAGERRMAICDVAFANGAEDCFTQALLDNQVPLRQMLSFSAWNTAANSVGSSLAHASLRLIALQDKGAFDLASLLVDLSPMRYLQLLDTLIDSETAHISLLFSHLADDWLYQTQIRPQVTDHVVNLLRASIFDLADSSQRVQNMVSDMLTRSIADLWTTHFLGKESVRIGPDDNAASVAVAELEETRITLPWGRLFEVDLRLAFGVELVATS